jgi:hypothetical protein
VYYPQEQINIKLKENIPIGTVLKLGLYMDESIPGFAEPQTTNTNSLTSGQGGFIFSPGN